MFLITLTLFVLNSLPAANIVGTGGRGGNDQIQGLAGHHRVIQNAQCVNGLKGVGENDIISGGKGSDCVMGGGGTDCLAGDSGNDIITGGNGADTKVSCGAGADTVYIGPNENDVVDNDCETVIMRP